MKTYSKKYRVKQIDNKFYPQKKILFIWCNMYTGNASGSYTASFPSIQSAKGFIDCVIQNKKYRPKKTIHRLSI